jgi:acetylornithine deacetylase/succinyl-diaminopimelate desuccinylase-like protein
MTATTDALRAELEEAVRHLASFERPSASEGERRAAEWIAQRLREHGCAARVEEERAHGSYWWPMGLLCGVAAAGALTGRRFAALAAGAFATAAIADDITGRRQWFRRRLLPSRPTWNVVAETGDPEAQRTVLVVAHHDAAHTSLLFSPAPSAFVGERFPGLIERTDTTPPLMWPVIGGPLLVAAGALLGARGVRIAGTLLSLAAAGTFAEIGARRVVPGANDNLTGVATLIGLARRLAEEPVDGVRVLLVSTGSEESFMEGMQAFARRHFASLPRDRTHVVCVDTVGSPELVMLEGEGMLRMNDYHEAFRELVAQCAGQAGVHLRRGLRFRNATDALVALRAGYPTVTLGSVNRYKLPSNYHWPTDTPDNVDFTTTSDAVALCREVVQNLAVRGWTSSTHQK